ncbi:MAG: hypothetical protein IZT59_13370 [Verrucomicrobia bacterium]|jgi:hypothetical protein|nr:hypothetical protein [Verrucomicrobiota bacterium]|tara:strand:- start:6184 stop:6642 length:459 start_codon:yes stop_codon:yes gene_type:complete
MLLAELVLSSVETNLDALQESPDRSVHAQAIKIREVLPAMNTALRMAGVDKVFVGLNQLTGASLVDSFHDGTRSIQNMLTGTKFPGSPNGIQYQARGCSANAGLPREYNRQPISILKGFRNRGQSDDPGCRMDCPEADGFMHKSDYFRRPQP